MSRRDAESHTDELLLQRIAEGDSSAFSAVYERYWELLFNEAYKRLGHLQLCEEVVQDIFCDLWEAREKRHITDLRAYLLSCVRYQVFACYKKQKREVAADSEANIALYDSAAADSSFLEKDLVQFVDTWLSELPEKRREIFRLRYMEGFTTKEISDQLHVSQNTVQNHLGTSLSRLRAILKKHFLFFMLF